MANKLKLTDKQFQELKKIVEAHGVEFRKFAEGSEEFREQAMKNGYERYRQKFPQVFGLEVDPTPDPEPEPNPEPTGDVLYDSHIHSKLHDGKVRTIRKEGNISPGGLGVECRASGSPNIVVNADGTFSLICDAGDDNKGGHGRFYGYVLNYNSTLEIECAFWNEAKGQDLSLKGRSQHNEGPDGREDAKSMGDVHGDAFGGYGLSIDRKGWGSKREPEHNYHDQSTSGKTPFPVRTKEYFTIRHTIKDEGNAVRQIGEMNGTKFMDKKDERPLPFMVDKERYNTQSYHWVRQNIDEGRGEIRIKRIRVLKA